MKVNNKHVSSELFPPFTAGTYTPLSKWVCIQADKVEKLKGRKLILGGGQGNTYLALLAAGWPCVQGVDVFGSLSCLRLEAENAGFPGLVLISLTFLWVESLWDWSTARHQLTTIISCILIQNHKKCLTVWIYSYEYLKKTCYGFTIYTLWIVLVVEQCKQNIYTYLFIYFSKINPFVKGIFVCIATFLKFLIF